MTQFSHEKLLKLFLLFLAVSLLFSMKTFAEITVVYDADPVSLDPHEQLSGGTLQLSHMVFDPLVRHNQNLEIEPRLATSWTPTKSGALDIQLRKGVRFHSGREMTADDVIWTFKRIQTSTDFKGIFQPIKKIEKINAHQIRVITHKPYPLLLNILTYLFPMDSKFYSGKTANGKDKSLIIKHGDSFASQHTSGTGPYVITYREQGIRINFKRFQDYWDKQSVGNVQDIVLLPISENATRVASLLSGKVDFIAPVEPNDHSRIKRSSGLQLVTMPGTRIISIQMNQKQNAALKNKKVRQAINYAIDQATIVSKIMRGFATQATQMSPVLYLGHNPALEPRFDLDRARQLMLEAGYSKGLTLSMIAPNNRYINDEKIAEAIVNMLAKINITVDLRTMPKAQYWPEFDKCAGDLLMIGWHADTEDSANFFEFLQMTRDNKTGMGQYNCGHYSNPEVDDLVKRANSEMNPARRSSLLQQVEHILYKDAAFVPLHWQNLAWAAKDSLDIAPIVNAMNFPYFDQLKETAGAQ